MIVLDEVRHLWPLLLLLAVVAWLVLRGEYKRKHEWELERAHAEGEREALKRQTPPAS